MIKINENTLTIFISPLNNVYAFNSTYHFSNLNLLELINIDSKDRVLKIGTADENTKESIKSIVKVLPYVRKEFLEKMKERNIKLKLYTKKEDELEIVKIICEILGLQEFFKIDEDIISLENLNNSNNSPKNIAIGENVEDLLYFNRSGFYTVYNSLLFKDTPPYVELQKKNLNILKNQKNAFKPDLIVETLRQTNELIFYLNENRNSSPKEYFNNAYQVVYMFDTKSASKNYRKREVALSTNKVRFTPLLHRNCDLNEEYEEIYGEDVKVFLQRCPYYYLDNQKFCENLENLLVKNQSLIFMHNFKYIDLLFNRYNVYNFLVDFVKKIKDDFFRRHQINIEVPASKYFSIQEDIKYLEDDSKEIDVPATLNSIRSHIVNLIDQTENLKYPFIIKPDTCTEHEMFLIFSYEGIESFANGSNLKKIIKWKNFIAQQFIPHGGLMFKNYYLNEKSLTIVRPSIPNIEGKFLDNKLFENKCYSFHNEFLYSKEDPTLWEEAEKFNKDVESVTVESDIDKNILDEVSKLFVDVTSVSLFGLDYVIDKKNRTYYLIEVNYFPSFRELGSRLSEEFAEHIIQYYNKFNKGEINKI
jgi:hypothetical protein